VDRRAGAVRRDLRADRLRRVRLPAGGLTRRAPYPPAFVARHPVRTARNLVGNHPSKLADRYLLGLRGVEIGGAAHNDFFLDTVNVDYQTAPSTADAQLRYTGRRMTVDVIARADALPFGDDSYDFVLASHVLEHIPDPIAALRDWTRVARRYVLIILPQPTNEFDAHRELTTADELFERHRDGFSSEEDRHWNVWSSGRFRELCERLDLRVVEVQDPDDKRGNGFAVVLGAGPAVARDARPEPPGG
jgi:SAM-dependent methyltransferase